MGIVAKTPLLLVEEDQDKMLNYVIGATFKNSNPDSAIRAMHIALWRENETGNRRMDVAIFEDKKRTAGVERLQPLKIGRTVFAGKDIKPTLWEFAVKNLEFSKDIDVITCPILDPLDGTILAIIRKLDKTKELKPDCKELVLKMGLLILPPEPEKALLDHSREEIAGKLKAAFG